MIDDKITNIEKMILNDRLYYSFLNDLSLDQQGEVSLELSKLSKQDDTVLNVEPDEVLQKECVALLFDSDTDEVISFCTMMKPYYNKYGKLVGEIGTMFTVSEWQDQGCASFLVKLIDDWAAKGNRRIPGKPPIDGAYAFLNTLSPRAFAVNDYRGSVVVDNSEVNAGDYIPDYAIELCRTICKDEKAMRLMDIEKYLDRPFVEVNAENISLHHELEEARAERAIRFEKYIQAIDKKLAENGSISNYAIYGEIKQFYRDNLKNNLKCCDVVVAKSYNN